MSSLTTVLLIDDDEEILSAMQTVLEREGFRVLTATDGNRGLALAETEAPAVIVCDMMMPQKSGLLVVEKLKARRRPPAVVMITANEVDRHRLYAESLGVDEYLHKPFDMAVLVDVVNRHSRRKS
ncbi:MAG: hypothetical protein KatS3mg105_3742 [Gemmatales bacterium]|nr:MAG: hypothetical protein KatS3mg105_3742 [Gemmatales bacterium]